MRVKETIVNRREALRRGTQTLAAASSLGALFSGGCLPSTSSAKTIKVGLLHSQTGTMAISETSLRDMEIMAIEEINASGGVLGRLIEPVLKDPKSRSTDLFPKKAKELLLDDKVAVVFGCWTSSGRKAVLPVFEEHNGLLFYPVQYEGNESSKNVIYGGAVPNQQILPALDWLLGPSGGSKKRFYLLGSDYVFPRTANLIIQKYLGTRGADVAKTTYVPLGQRDYMGTVEEIKKLEPDVVFSTINGDSNIAFYNELADQGVTAKQIPVVATSVGEDELRNLRPEKVEGHMAAWTYFQTVPTPGNRQFVERFQSEWGSDRVMDDPMEAAYCQVYLWKLAAEKAGSFLVDEIRTALRSGIEFDAPGGKIRIDPKNQHTYKRFRMGRIRKDWQFDIVHESTDWIEPDPYPQVAFPGWHCDWTKDGLAKGQKIEID
jgi:urea transport system substrate-binding protein